MAPVMVVGCLLVAYGPPVVLLLSYVVRRSALLVLTIGSAFFWLISILVTSLIWLAVPPLKTVHVFPTVIGVIVQEAVRLLFAHVYAKSERQADRIIHPGGPKLFNDLAAGIAGGVGYGLMHTVMMYGAVLTSSSSEPAWYRTSTCPQINAFVLTAFITLFTNALHVCLTIVVIDAYRRAMTGGAGWNRVIFLAPVLHLSFALITLLPEASFGGGATSAGGGACVATLPLLLLILGVCVFLVARVVNAPDYAAKRQVRAWEVLTAQRVAAMHRAADTRAAVADATRGAGRDGSNLREMTGTRRR